ncbi:universal stress protein A-like protein [Papaver somniferum]|uniref:universal stress protein A-like protein n=1 Tax=Papaver somniferum TaxID=3469 RepID=UPI000E6F7614|nr:universal stress protein A-like protein [Papaver somniferum]
MADMDVQERKIVVAIDEGEESIYALTWAIKNNVFVVSQKSNDTILLLYAKPHMQLISTLDEPEYLFSSDVIISMEKYSKDVSDCVIEKAKRVCKDLQSVKVEIRVEEGDPRDVICDVVEKIGADILVMGTHGYGMIKRALLGSVSTHCAQNVKCPVLIVKRPKSEVGNKSS